MRRWLALWFVLAALGLGQLACSDAHFPGDPSAVLACEQNLRAIYQALLAYQQEHGELPRERGARFLAALDGPEIRARLTCPAVDRGALPIGAIEDQAQWFHPLEAVDGTRTAYAARDNVRFPLRRLPGPHEQILVADDNDGGANHRARTLVLRADGSVTAYDSSDSSMARMPGEQSVLRVGPRSPIAELRTLSPE